MFYLMLLDSATSMSLSCSLIAGFSRLQSRTVGRVIIRGLSYFVITTLMGTAIALVVCTVIRPGKGPLKEEMKNYLHVHTITLSNPIDAIIDVARLVFLVYLSFPSLDHWSNEW